MEFNDAGADSRTRRPDPEYQGEGRRAKDYKV
jgi:hypothetical protein